jgi:zinc transport system ATP-binding protein
MTSTNSAALLEARDLVIGWPGSPLLPALSFAIRAGEVTSIVGHNGSGKSTLLRTLLGLQPGVGGDLVRGRPALRIGYVPQREAMDPIYPVTVEHLVQTGRYGFRGVGKSLRDEDLQVIEAALERTGISKFRDRLVRTLSGGEQQRALLARAWCTEPDVLFLDEPTASMDERGATELMDLTLRLASERQTAIVMVNHFLDLVRKSSHQVVALDRDHQRVTVGAPSKVLLAEGVSYGG